MKNSKTVKYQNLQTIQTWGYLRQRVDEIGASLIKILLLSNKNEAFLKQQKTANVKTSIMEA